MIENDTITFGEHNVRATNLSPTKTFGSFPWQDYFKELGFQGQYPAILYTNDQVDALYEAMSSLLVSLGSHREAGYDLSIIFHDEIVDECSQESKAVGDMRISLRLGAASAEELSVCCLTTHGLRRLILRAIALHHAQEESYGLCVQLSEREEEGRYRLE